MGAQSLEFDMPFPGRVNPEIDYAIPRHLEWLDRFRLLPDYGSLEQYLDWGFPDLGSRWFPAAAGEDLDLALDAYAWMVVLDGQWDTHTGQDPVAVQSAVDSLYRVISGSLQQGADVGEYSAAGLALRDIWLRLCEGMPPSWCADMAKDWRSFFDSVVQEAVNRSNKAIPTEREYRANRDTTGYMRLLLRLSERMRHYAIPSRVGQDNAFQALTEPYVWAHNILQDLFSFEREAVQGDMHNIVFVLEHHRGMTRPLAVETAVGLLRDQFAAFTHAEPAHLTAWALLSPTVHRSTSSSTT
ncbi:hypothetical protein AB0N87_43725 [Streptomyces sp. NPDC093228]|jgi:hypothetical protein|uniref:terpene synthase family protein n=1 Tax=Streptomyces sp. NPDC093228 TaxID=3155070 RepID=UPI003420EF48